MIQRLPYPLLRFFLRHAAEKRSLALITVLETEGSTYSKAGSQMLVNESGDFHGMLSGGCLEGDLAERAKAVMDSGTAEVVLYDLRGDDDVFGLGVGCEGALQIFIQPLASAANYEPFASLVKTLEVAPSAVLPLGAPAALASTRVLAPLRLLILGAGMDAEPLILFTSALGWKVSVADHRPAAVQRLAALPAASIECVAVAEVAEHFDLASFDAVIVMSHNLVADRTYLEMLAAAPPEFVGLLGPPHRRDRLLGEIGAAADRLSDCLHAPVGRQIGGRGPASIALEIAAELQAYFCVAEESSA